MSISDDGELQELVKQALEKSGSMSKIRAELRANVFLALEENGCFEKMKTQNNKLQHFSKTTDGALLLCLIQEFLEYFGLSFTASVFNPELASYGIYCKCRDRSKLSDELNIENSVDDTEGPLLSQMLRIIRNVESKTKLCKINSENAEETVNQVCKSSDTSTEYLPLRGSNNRKDDLTKSAMEMNNNENLSKKPFTLNKCGKPIGTDNMNSNDSKYNLSSLNDLPPITSSLSFSKTDASFFKSEQLNLLKASLQDTMANNGKLFTSTICDDEVDEYQNETNENQTGSIEEESNFTTDKPFESS